MGSTAPLKDVVKKIISGLEKKEKEESDILRAWEKAAGRGASKHTKPAFLKAKRLIVNVSDSSWLYKLTLEKDRLIEKFNANAKGRKKIKELQFRIGTVKEIKEEG